MYMCIDTYICIYKYMYAHKCNNTNNNIFLIGFVSTWAQF